MKAFELSSTLTRVVKLTFHKTESGTFQKIFSESKDKIRNSEGCLYLELFQDKNKPEVFFTYSQWLSEKHLESYRKSQLFRETWEKTKVLFAEKAEAWTLHSLTRVP
jgi:quinol monooxygenase YgiN